MSATTARACEQASEAAALANAQKSSARLALRHRPSVQVHSTIKSIESNKHAVPTFMTRPHAARGRPLHCVCQSRVSAAHRLLSLRVAAPAHATAATFHYIHSRGSFRPITDRRYPITILVHSAVPSISHWINFMIYSSLVTHSATCAPCPSRVSLCQCANAAATQRRAAQCCTAQCSVA